MVGDKKRRGSLSAYLNSPKGYESGYEKFKIGVMFKIAREEAGLTQEQLAEKLKTKKTAISRIENHAEDISCRC
ncbi:MAG: helix-turn-helix transcriptional regulator [Desulfurivibrio sp.]|nr:helix-turn-helix transcriptional regulator [Desulfurivibrio sp.]